MTPAQRPDELLRGSGCERFGRCPALCCLRKELCSGSLRRNGTLRFG
jgi:hypothetical protein